MNFLSPHASFRSTGTCSRPTGNGYLCTCLHTRLHICTSVWHMPCTRTTGNQMFFLYKGALVPCCRLRTSLPSSCTGRSYTTSSSSESAEQNAGTPSVSLFRLFWLRMCCWCATAPAIASSCRTSQRALRCRRCSGHRVIRRLSTIPQKWMDVEST